LNHRIKAIMASGAVGVVAPVPGVSDFLASLGDRTRAIASSSSPQWIMDHLDQLGLRSHFDDKHIFSAAIHVARGKPHPDIYLHAAKSLGVSPDRVTVIEELPHWGRRGLCSGGTGDRALRRRPYPPRS